MLSMKMNERLLTTLASPSRGGDPERPPIPPDPAEGDGVSSTFRSHGELAALNDVSGIAANHRKTASQESWMYRAGPFTFMMPHTRNSRLWPAQTPI